MQQHQQPRPKFFNKLEALGKINNYRTLYLLLQEKKFSPTNFLYDHKVFTMQYITTYYTDTISKS